MQQAVLLYTDVIDVSTLLGYYKMYQQYSESIFCYHIPGLYTHIHTIVQRGEYHPARYYSIPLAPVDKKQQKLQVG